MEDVFKNALANINLLNMINEFVLHPAMIMKIVIHLLIIQILLTIEYKNV